MKQRRRRKGAMAGAGKCSHFPESQSHLDHLLAA